MAAHNLPSLVLVDVRDGAEPRSLTNAFVDPVRPVSGPGGGLVAQSIDRLARHLVALEKVYGSNGRKDLSFVAVDDAKEDDAQDGDAMEGVCSTFSKRTGAKDRGTLDKLIESSVVAAFGKAP